MWQCLRLGSIQPLARWLQTRHGREMNTGMYCPDVTVQWPLCAAAQHSTLFSIWGRLWEILSPAGCKIFPYRSTNKTSLQLEKGRLGRLLLMSYNFTFLHNGLVGFVVAPLKGIIIHRGECKWMMAGQPRKKPPAQSFLVNYKALRCKHKMTSTRNSLLLDVAGLRVWCCSLHRRGQAMRKQLGAIVLGTVIFLLLLPPACLPACQGLVPLRGPYCLLVRVPLLRYSAKQNSTPRCRNGWQGVV